MKHSCTTIRDGQSCPFLVIRDEKAYRTSFRLYSCSKMNITIFPTILSKGTFKEELIGVSPDFNCPEMVKLRTANNALPVAMSISGTNIKTWNHKSKTFE